MIAIQCSSNHLIAMLEYVAAGKNTESVFLDTKRHADTRKKQQDKTQIYLFSI